ncbi:MAG: nucleotidyltransferase domain-containing protein [Ignavibacteriae bacterium]|nr:nucleotidyltransferase domain-containing protein [Ignavibacteriota bacterium]
MDIALPYLSVEENAVLSAIKVALAKLLHDQSYRLILFGSKARGDFDKTSDLDLAIIVDDLDRSMKNGIMMAVADVELEHLYYVSTLILSTAEFNHLRARERRIAREIESEGIEI